MIRTATGPRGSEVTRRASVRHRHGRAVSTARTERFSGGQTATYGSSATLLRVTNIAKAFGATQAVRDASFELRAGEVLALVGENGCGKSTMVKILSGVHLPDAGEIELDGEVIPPPST